MKEINIQGENIDLNQVESALQIWLASCSVKLQRVLLLPPDFTRLHSKAGLIVRLLYRMLSPGCLVDIMPALGTHLPMSQSEKQHMFGPDIPAERYIDHDWRNDIIKIGEVPSAYIEKISGGLVNYAIDVEINRHLLDPVYDLIISIGQVIPHEVVGMANYSKNIFVGCGGKDMINKSHFLGAAFGMERIMGRADTPVRKIFDYAGENFLKNIPLQYILTVTTTENCGPGQEETKINGLFIGESRKLFDAAALLSQGRNLNLLERELTKVVVYLDPVEFKSTWLGNKAIYRTRMAIADGGELLIIAPGVKQFGEDKTIDTLIRRYGYVGSKRVLQLLEQEGGLRQNLSAAAHLIHGSSEGRFNITYAAESLSKEEVEQVNFNYISLDEAIRRYNPDLLKSGMNTLPGGEEIYFIKNPALGLWAGRDRFYKP